MTDHREIVRRNLDWFARSGVMRPADGFWGVAERVAITTGNEAAEKIRSAFCVQTALAPGVAVLEHRRADCNFETALMYDLAAEALGDDRLRAVSGNVLGYLLDRSALRDARDGSPTRGLWGWANPCYRESYWSDDNSWVVLCLLLLSRRGRPELREPGVAAARTLHRHIRDFLLHVCVKGKDTPLRPEPILGLRLNPHWIGLATMAFAHAAAADDATPYAETVSDYHDIVLSGPPVYDERSCRAAVSGLPWALSEYAYLALTASIAAKQFDLHNARDTARFAADTLVENQQPTGHFRSEHYETPGGAHLADLIYTQNWATLGLAHAARLFDSAEYRRAFERSLDFLARIQDRSTAPWLAGCWRGLYDTRAGDWGGGDRYEGGQGSLYSGWTNAPISIAFLLETTGHTLFAKD